MLMGCPPCTGVCVCLVAGVRTRVVVVATILSSVYQMGPKAGRNADQGVDLQGGRPQGLHLFSSIFLTICVSTSGGRPQGPPPLIHVLSRPYGIKLPV